LIVTVLRKKIAQMIMTGVGGGELTPAEENLFRAYPFGGYILFGRNCREPGQIVSLCRSLWQASGSSPPFIAIDHEGGKIHRLPPHFTHFPAARTIGQKDDAHLAYRSGRASGTELTMVGINLNFAPVLDIDSNPKNPIIGARAFGSEADQVIRMATAWTQGLRAGGIIPCAKHFPGHGDTDQDSHLCLPSVDRPPEALRARELLPFAHACRQDIESLMTAHVLFRSFDLEFPATLSSKIVGGLLRDELHYQGVVFSDDLGMKAVSDFCGAEEGLRLAVGAGLDMLMFCHDSVRAVYACELLCREAQRDPHMRARVEESYARITKLKRRCLKKFSGLSTREVARRLAGLAHEKIVAEIQGSL
jgi:beta-N-acetylhexosaminidase